MDGIFNYFTITGLYTFFLLFLLSPLFAFIFIGGFGRFISTSSLFSFATLNLSLAWLLFLPLLYSVATSQLSFEVALFDWIDIAPTFEFNFIVDPLGIEMGMVVMIISTCV